jgi:lysophospholipase L1-like esterase
MRTLIFGDSIAYGCWDTEGGWADRLKRDTHREYVTSSGKVWNDVLNLGVSGDTSSHIRDRLRAEIEFRSHDSAGLTLIFAFGTNDAKTIDNQAVTAHDRFKENVQDIVLTAQAYADRIMFVGMPPLGVPELHEANNIEFDDKRIVQYEIQLQEIVERAGLLFVPIRETFEDHGLEGLYAFDNLHPKDEGHKIIYDIVKAGLDRL